IRVSVVATGIEAEAVHQPQPGKVFTFPTARTPVPSPTPAPMLDESDTTAELDEDDTLDLSDMDNDGDELLLDTDDILTSVTPAPIEPPADEEEIEPDMTGDEDNGTKIARESGTLFERMSNIARDAAKAQVDEEETAQGFRREPIDIPRFLNRQNNQ